MQNNIPKKLILVSILLILFLAGCATVPSRDNLPTYSINGTNYVSLVSLCKIHGISWNYDTVINTVFLSKDEHRANLRVGDTLALVDGEPVHQKYPVDLYQGVVMVPYCFKEQVVDNWSKETSVTPKTRVSLLNVKKIVIDAGHGGTDPGAIGKTGLREKDVNLDIVKRLAKLFKDSGVEVVMTRSTDTFISLERRVEIANNARADLFISIHSNANRVRGLNGLEVYYITSEGNDLRRALNAAQHYKLDLAAGSLGSHSLDLKATLWDMIYTANRAESASLARAVCRSVERDLDTRVIGTKTANFFVLKGASIPAILIEVGFVSNPQEERLLKNSYYRQQVAESIMRGIQNYTHDYMYAQGN